MYCFFQSKTSLESASKMDPKARLTLSKPMTPSTSSSGLTASARPRRRLRVPARLAGWKRLSLCHPMDAECPRERPPWSRWSSRTVSQTVAWTPASSAPTASAWSRRTLVRAKSKQKPMFDKNLQFVEENLSLTCTVFAFHTWNHLEKHFQNTFCDNVNAVLVFVPVSVVL